MVKIRGSEAIRRIRQIQKNIEEQNRKDIDDELELLGLNRNDPDLKKIVEKIIEKTESERALLKILNKRFETNKAVNIKRTFEIIDRIRSKKNFYVNLAYIRKQEKINGRLLRLNRDTIRLTILVLLLMAVQIFLMVR